MLRLKFLFASQPAADFSLFDLSSSRTQTLVSIVSNLFTLFIVIGLFPIC